MSDLTAFQSALERAWTIETSSKWLADNPARGQCSVTALVIQDILGGDIVKTDVDGAWHFYNLVDGQRLDFSESQFCRWFPTPTFRRDDALSDTSRDQYRLLRDRLLRELARGAVTVV